MMKALGVVWMILCLAAAGPARAESPAIPHLEVRGSGDTALVLVHGLHGDWSIWESFMDRVADRYTTLAVRLPGCAGSETLPIPDGDPLDRVPWTETVSAALLDELRQHEFEQIIAVGHGLGVMIAIEMVVDEPGLFDGLVLIEGMPAYPLNFEGYHMDSALRIDTVAKGILKTSSEQDPISWRVRWKEIAARQTTDPEGSELLAQIAEKMDFYAWRRWVIEHYVPDRAEDLRASGVRVLAAACVNGGMRSLLGTRPMIEEFWRLPFDGWDDANVTFFDETRHYLMLDRPGEFDTMIDRFVSAEPQPVYSYREPPVQLDTAEPIDE